MRALLVLCSILLRYVRVAAEDSTSTSNLKLACEGDKMRLVLLGEGSYCSQVPSCLSLVDCGYRTSQRSYGTHTRDRLKSKLQRDCGPR